MIRVMLVDDHRVVQSGLRSYLSAFEDMEVVGAACSGEEAQDVLRQLAHGRTNREIGQALHVSEETVKTHVGNILSKLQLSHRTQAVIYAIKQGLVSVEDIELS
ncbi:MAG TPA: LuxR C-terminal-related transcriptional regulator [Thermoanaerobaculia bacterium]